MVVVLFLELKSEPIFSTRWTSVSKDIMTTCVLNSAICNYYRCCSITVTVDGYVAHFNTSGIYFHESSTILSLTMDQILEGHWYKVQHPPIVIVTEEALNGKEAIFLRKIKEQIYYLQPSNKNYCFIYKSMCFMSVWIYMLLLNNNFSQTFSFILVKTGNISR